MSIYHFGQMKIVSRGTGRSAVASSAYISGEKLHNEYDGITHNYTKKQGVVFKEVMLPENAPKEWKDRQKLWNEVEKTEKSKSSQLARSFDVGLQTEFTLEENIKLIKGYVKNNFVDKGMCADICIHDKEDGNPHAHVMLTMRKIDEQGKFLPKAKKKYLCRNGHNEEKYFDSNQLKGNKDFEKVYKCKYKNEYKELTNSELKKEKYKDYKKVSKYPVDKKIDICADWNDKNNVELWRENWAKVNNELFKKKGLDIKIDHRSYEKQGIDIMPTIHEGYGARLRVKRGKGSDRVDINKYIKSLNEKIKEYKNEIYKLTSKALELNKQIDELKKVSREETRINHPSNLSNINKDNIKDMLKELKEKLSKGDKERFELDDTLNYIENKQIKTIDDIKEIRSQLSNIKEQQINKINTINNYIESMNLIYNRLKKKTIEVKLLEKEVNELGIFKFKQKHDLKEKINNVKNEIDRLKESEFYQKDMKYSSKLGELTKVKDECIKVLKDCEREGNYLYNIEVLNKDKEKLINKPVRNKNINLNRNIKKHFNDLDI